VQLRVLGPIEIYNGHKLAIGGPRQRRIIAALAVQPGEVVSLDRLVDIIWAGEEMPKQAERNVRTYVHRIRQALGDDLADRLETAPPGYVFRLKADELDAGRFERSYAEAGRLRDRGDSDGALVRIEEALDLWRGDPYAEFGAESWARVEATRLVEIRVSALELRCQVHLDLNRAPEALAELGALIADHPLREGPRALYMQALYRSGRQAEALRAFQGFRDYLIDEAGVTPTDDLVELDRSIASGDLPHSGSSQQIRGYEIHELIGRGAFAEVHRGWQPGLGREVAVKAIQAELANRPEFIRGFEAEAAIIARLEHPYIVPLYDFWREPDQAYLVMRWLPGGSLESRIGSGPLSIEQTAEMVEQVGSALALAHRSGVVHRDVKSANILLDGEGNSYLADFGIAVDVAGDKNPAASLSEGSPAYASPEQIRREHVGPAADIHGLAIAAYEALTGQLPFPASADKPSLLRRQLNEPIPAATLSRPELPQAVDDVLAVATAKDPSARYQDVATFVADFV
jgi:DNA-binding SARP family transcriptional activator